MLTYPHFEPHFPRSMWSLPAILEHQARERPDRPFLSWGDEGEPLSFARTNARVNSLAHGLTRQGVKRGGKVVLFLPNCLEYILTWFALAKLGAIEVTIGEIQKGEFLARQIVMSGAERLVTTADLLPRVIEVADLLPALQAVYIVGGGAANVDAARVAVMPFDSLYSGDVADPGVAVLPQETGAVLYTSGTTGLSKGVVMPHSQLYFFAQEDVNLVGLTEDDVYMTGFPLSHGNAQFLTVYPCLIAGAHCVIYPKFSASEFSRRASRCGATVTNLIGAVMSFILAANPSDFDRRHRLRCIYAAPLAFDLADAFQERFGDVTFVDGFGQTEISLVFMTPPGAARPEGASGVLVDQFFEIRLVDPETGDDVQEGQIGELLVRNRVPGIMCTEYLGMPDKTVETCRDLWFHTGDGMRRDVQGWYYFADRVKDALRRRGENISSFEVESVVRTFPGIVEVAVVGVRADEKAGEDEVKACLILDEGATLDHAALIGWCDEHMPSHMVPRYIEIFDQLPKTPSEKIKKKELREQGVGSATWDRNKAGVRIAKER